MEDGCIIGDDRMWNMLPLFSKYYYILSVFQAVLYQEYNCLQEHQESSCSTDTLVGHRHETDNEEQYLTSDSDM